jgi:hypothetical protein
MKISSIRWGVILLGIGLLFLAINLGYLSHHVWWSLIKLWPVFLIAIGIEMIFRNGNLRALAFLSPIIVAAAFAYAAIVDNQYDSYDWHYSFNSDNYDYSNDSRESKRFEFDREDSLKNLQVNFDFVAGQIWVGPTSRSLFSGDFEYWRSSPSCRIERDNLEAKIYVKSQEGDSWRFFGRHRSKNDARIFIGDYLPVDLRLKSAAASVDMDLSEMIVENVRIDAGASDVALKLGCRAKEIMIKIDSGASKVRLSVPPDMAIRLKMDAVISPTNFHNLSLRKTSDGYESDNYSASSCKADIELDSGVSLVELDTY